MSKLLTILCALLLIAGIITTLLAPNEVVQQIAAVSALVGLGGMFWVNRFRLLG